MSIRFRLPTDLSDRIAARAARDGRGASSVSTALRILEAHVDDDLGGKPPPRRTLLPPQQPTREAAAAPRRRR